MKIIEEQGITSLIAEEGKLIINKTIVVTDDSYIGSPIVVLGSNDSPDNYEEVERPNMEGYVDLLQ